MSGLLILAPDRLSQSGQRAGGRIDVLIEARESERAVDMNPCVVVVGSITDCFERIDRAGVHVARLRADDGWPRRSRHLLGADAALIVDGNPHDSLAPETEKPQSLQ